MPTYRVHKDKNFTVMSNVHLRDKRLSLKAKGLLSMMLSMSDEWEHSIASFESVCKESRYAISSAFKELEDVGYVIAERSLPTKGDPKIRYTYSVYETSRFGCDVPAGQDNSRFSALDNQPLKTAHIETTIEEDTYKEEFQSQVDLRVDSSSKEDSLDSREAATKEVEAIIDYLNSRVGGRYTYRNKKTNSLISARLGEGFTVEDFKAVIDNKVASWKGTEWEKFLRPSTLFAPGHFEEYLNERRNSVSDSLSSYMDGWDIEYRSAANGA